jgi:glucokinase
MGVVIGFDIGGTNLKLGLFDRQLKLLDNSHVPNPADITAELLVEHAYEAASAILKKNGLSLTDLDAAGIGCPGTINMKDGVVVAAPNLPFRHTPLRQMLSDELGCPCIVENDANAAAWGEYAAGAAKDVDDMVFFTLGTGIGGGIICDGTMIRGYSGQAGELGHMIIYPDSQRVCGCGQKGCAEVYASASHTANRANERLGAGVESSLNGIFKTKGSVTSKDIFNHAQQGDAFATEIVDCTAKTLGILCINTLHFTEPQRIVFAGGMIAAGDFLLNKINEQFYKHIWTMQEQTLEICFATLGEDAGIYGAGDLAIRLVENSKS